mmetsp:Transcript_8910/g.10668  ORF Transcript_8910/g.10668 Transcript_8910/m.10668 type:complete len:161 (+) Transcript_8910:137-619(+)
MEDAQQRAKSANLSELEVSKEKPDSSKESEDIEHLKREKDLKAEINVEAHSASELDGSVEPASDTFSHLLEEIVRGRDIVGISNIQDQACDKIVTSTRYLEQFNTRSESLLAQEDVGPKLERQIKQLNMLTWRMQSIYQRVERLKEAISAELKESNGENM